MPRLSKPRSWKDYVSDLKQGGYRWTICKPSNTPFIFVRDKDTGKKITCKPLLNNVNSDIEQVIKAIIETGDKEWLGIKEESEQLTKSVVPTWVEIINLCNKDWPLRVKDSTRKTWDCELNNLLKDDVPRD